MKTLWKTIERPDPDVRYVAVVTDLAALSRRSTPALFRGARAASRQIARAEGIVGFATSAEPLRKRYRTISLWRDEESVSEFARSGDHAALLRTLGPALASSRSHRWTHPGERGRVTWEEALRRLAAAAEADLPVG